MCSSDELAAHPATSPQEPVENGLSYGAESTQGLFYYYFVQKPRSVRTGGAAPAGALKTLGLTCRLAPRGRRRRASRRRCSCRGTCGTCRTRRGSTSCPRSSGSGSGRGSASCTSHVRRERRRVPAACSHSACTASGGEGSTDDPLTMISGLADCGKPRPWGIENGTRAKGETCYAFHRRWMQLSTELSPQKTWLGTAADRRQRLPARTQ